MGSLAVRIIERELLQSTADDQVDRILSDLARINRWLGTYFVLPGLFREWFGRNDAFTCLDVGAASGDVGRHVMQRFPRAKVISVDAAYRHLAATPGLKLAGDGFQLPLRTASVDVVMCSLFLHHFSNEEVVRLLREMSRVARVGVIAVDLERHWMPRAFLPATSWLFGWHPITVHDGILSVKAAFRKRELEELGRASGFRDLKVRRHIPWFRLSLAGKVFA
jgi:ubiquinone/menaquinone biosynthesis C-methylase UbiE